MVDFYNALYGVKRPLCLPNSDVAGLFKPQKVKESTTVQRDAVKLDLEDTLILHKSPPRNEPGDFKSIEIINDEESFVIDERTASMHEIVDEEPLEIKMESEEYKIAKVKICKRFQRKLVTQLKISGRSSRNRPNYH